MQRKGFTLLPWLAAVWVFIVSGCQPQTPTGSVQLMGRVPQALSASDVTRVVVMVTAPGMAPLTTELVKTEGQWGATLGRIPAGTDRTFTAEAFGADGAKLFAGTATGVTITPGQTALVAIMLQELAARPPFDNAVPSIDSLVSSASSAYSGENVTLRATAHDPNPGDVLAYTWTASAGTLGSASSAMTTWTAPEATDPVTLTLTVTDPHGSSASVSLVLKVRGGRGSADIEVSLNTWPQVARIVATPSRVNVGERTTVVASASDADGDALTYQWSASGCTGSFVDATSATARFTPDALPPTGSCGCRLGVTVADGHGGQARGTLAICVGSPTVPLFAPEFVEFFQSSATVPTDGTVTLRVQAEDPQGSALTFSWAASLGTLDAPASGATTSEVRWKAPTCVPGGGAAFITATVGNALGLSSSTTFTVVGLPACVRSNAWTSIGGFSRLRMGHTATLLPSGGVLVSGASWGPVPDEVFDPETGLSDILDSVSWTRFLHTATTLPSGKILMTGGGSSGSTEADLFDPVSWTRAPTSPMATARMGHTATLLPSGKVLVTGGRGVNEVQRTAELYDPATGTWSTTGSLSTPRSFHTATLLPSGKVLVVGGHEDSQPPTTAEVYDPGTGTWAPTSPPQTSMGPQTATLLPSGRVLLVSGTLATVFDPDTETWTPVTAPSVSHGNHTATLLPSGKVLVAGSTMEVFNPATGTWTTFGGSTANRLRAQTTLLPSGKVLAQGGDLREKAEVYDPLSRSWRATGSMSTARPWHKHTATLLRSGRVLVAGGSGDSGELATAEVYDPATETWSPTGDLHAPRSGHIALLLPTGKVLVLGGHVTLMEVYDPDTGTWAEAGHLVTYRQDFTATLLPSGKVLVVGGTSRSGDFIPQTEVYDPATGTWTLSGPLSSPRRFHTATLLTSGKVLVAGGLNSTVSAEVYDPATGAWTPMGDMLSPRFFHTATLLRSGKVLVVGGINGSYPVYTAELFDPSTGSWGSAGDFTGGPYDSYEHSATLLGSGQVLVTRGDGPSAGTLLYTP
ncbi:MAG TPA: kelch repeat-containing protein [Archangium sp.]|nr:kelch repeat-containing protein [Archangium sp.]